MKKQNNPTTPQGGKHGSDPHKNDPTKQDERDNDATRIRPEKESPQKPATPPNPERNGPSNPGIEDPAVQPLYKRTPENVPNPVKEPERQPGGEINKGYNPAAPGSKQNDPIEKDDSGNPVMKNYGKGL